MTDDSAVYFLNRDMALKTALEQNRTKLDGPYDVLPICYYDGMPFEDAPQNLINVPSENFIEFFSSTGMRLPDLFQGESDEEQSKGMMLVKILEKVTEIRDVKQVCYRKIRDKTNPDFRNNELFCRNDINNDRETRGGLNEMIAVSQKKKVNVNLDIDDYDLYFFDRDLAREIALRNNRIKFVEVYDVTQICYYDGTPLEDAPPNLVNVPVENFVNFFSTSSMRIPQKFITTDDEEKARELLMFDLLEYIKKIRRIKSVCYATMIQQRKPDFMNDKPWRVYLPVTRYSDVWQYCIKNLAKALQKKGCDARVYIEEDDMHNNLRDNYQLVRQAVEFKPHIWVSISQNVMQWLNPDIFHVAWWQDAPLWLGTAPIDWRERDILYSQYRYVDELLKKTGAQQVTRQGIGIDLDIYRPMPEVERKRKVVFIGSSYKKSLKAICSEFKSNDEIIEEIEKAFNKGHPVTMEMVASLSSRYNIPANVLYEKHINYVMRERAVEWLCQCRDIEVEVYGRAWEDNETVMPFFKGELPYGEAVARIYNEAKYALSVNPIEVNTQRLAEMGACGCIPVVYDCRYRAEKPHWGNECLFFRTREELYSCFNSNPSGDPEDIGKAFSYDIFAEKIITMIQDRTGASVI